MVGSVTNKMNPVTTLGGARTMAARAQGMAGRDGARAHGLAIYGTLGGVWHGHPKVTALSMGRARALEWRLRLAGGPGGALG